MARLVGVHIVAVRLTRFGEGEREGGTVRVGQSLDNSASKPCHAGQDPNA